MADNTLTNLPQGEKDGSSGTLNNDSHAQDAPVILDSDEVIELHAFLERKSWIEDKISLLERMPPIEVFVGVEHLLNSSGPVPGLPTRELLQSWLEEHDRIEAETEQFDKGDMNRLKKFAKAKSKQNLSPADTDLIELTLTTLLALDKLIHLLRVRSDNLELMTLRLSWEELRLAAWLERDSLLKDVEAFIKSRARWSSSSYQTLASSLSLPLPPTSPSLVPRVVSPTSTTFPSTESGPAAFSRSTRYKMAERLTQEAAAFGSRISRFRQEVIGAPGRIVDKIIDTSRQAVPDTILDEQEKLENGCNTMDGLGKFVMNVVVQWKKADELFGELKKDQATAVALVAEIESAQTMHPNPRQEETFSARSTSLASRVKLVGDLSKLIPRPSHPLYQDQPTFNQSILSTLASEHALALKQAQGVASKAKQYNASVASMKDVEKYRDSLLELMAKLRTISTHFLEGTVSRDGDGSPLDLSNPDCLDPLRHGAYLALLPALVADIDDTDNQMQRTLTLCRMRLLDLGQVALDPSFKDEVLSVIDNVDAERRKALAIKDGAVANAQQLRDIRKIWTSICDAGVLLDVTRQEVNEAVELQRWRPQRAHDGGPLTPESPMSMFASPLISSSDVKQRLDNLSSQLVSSVFEPLSSPLSQLQPRVHLCLKSNCDDVTAQIKALRNMTLMWDDISKQANVMTQVMAETHDLERKIDNLRIATEEARQAAAEESASQEDLLKREIQLKSDVDDLRVDVKTFAEKLWSRIPFISSHPPPLRAIRSNSSMRISRQLSFSAQGPSMIRTNSMDTSVIESSTWDAAVRADANAFSLSVTSGVDALNRKWEHLRLVRLARAVDRKVQLVLEELHVVTQETENKKASFDELRKREYSESHADYMQALATLRAEVEELAQSSRPKLTDTVISMRDAFKSLKTTADQDQDNIFLSRQRSVEDAESRDIAVAEAINLLRGGIADAEGGVLHRKQLAEEDAARIEAQERQRLAAEERSRKEEAEKLRLKEEEKAQQEEVNRKRREQEESARLLGEERRRREAEALYRVQMEKLAQEELVRSQAEELTRLRAAEQVHLEEERKRAAQTQSSIISDEDVFGKVGAPEGSLSTEMIELRSKVLTLRNELTALGIHSLARPPASLCEGPSALVIPTTEDVAAIKEKFERILQTSSALPSMVNISSIYAELKSLKFEIEATRPLLARLDAFAIFSAGVVSCDAALSDLLEHIDSYPALPIVESQSAHSSDPGLPPEEQLSARVKFCNELIEDLKIKCGGIMDDPRVVSERDRIDQTWVELLDMSTDRVGRIQSRAPSASSSFSGRSDDRMQFRRTNSQIRPSQSRQRTSSQTSMTPVRRGPTTLRPELSSRSSSRFSNRSVSGPILSSIASPTSSLYSSTYASRQRTTSTSSIGSSTATPVKRQESSFSPRPRAQTFGKRRAPSPAVSEASTPSLSSSVRSTSLNPRQPRRSSGIVPSSFKLAEKKERRSYVPNPKNKLDVAVGDIVNKLPVEINIEAVPTVTWQDQSGKYWIGDSDPKLCFCRILRSRTVMVRVGGGWVELSKFIKDHYADLFRLRPSTSPPPSSMGTREERWITSATVLEAPETLLEVPDTSDTIDPVLRPPVTPEPKAPHRASLSPKISLTAPSNGNSPGSIKTSSPGSPLLPIQFIRRAEDADVGRPTSPTYSRSAGVRGRGTTPTRNAVPKTLVWRF